jgi:metallophosphoesterase (TIGR00282 family)
MKILIFGDTVGKIGRAAVKKILPELKTEFQPDLVILNAENLAHGFGITKKTITELREAGVDVFTAGNHITANPSGEEVFADPELNKIVLRPYNIPHETGRGYAIFEKDGKKVLIASLSGKTFMEKDNPDNFIPAADEILEKTADENLAARIFDFHAEATSEKAVLGLYLDGRVSAVVGTHTHVPTADERILSKGTAFISDIGLCGAHNQAIGGALEPILKGMKIGELGKFEVPESGPVEVNAVLLETDETTGLAKSIKRIRKVL